MLKHFRKTVALQYFEPENKTFFLLKKNCKNRENYLRSRGNFRNDKNCILGFAQTNILLLGQIATDVLNDDFFISISDLKNIFYVLTITLDKNYYFHPSSVISPLKDFTLYMYINTCSSSKDESTNILLRLFETRTK